MPHLKTRPQITVGWASWWWAVQLKAEVWDDGIHLDFAMLCYNRTILGTICTKRIAEKSKIWWTKKRRKKHDMVHKKRQTRAWFGAWRNAEKKRFGGRRNKQNMSWVLLHEEMQKKKGTSGAKNGAINCVFPFKIAPKKKHTRFEAPFGARAWWI